MELHYIQLLLIDRLLFGPIQELDDVIEDLQRLGTVNLGIVTYPECESCDEVSDTSPVTSSAAVTDPALKYNKVGSGTAVRDKLTLYLECEQYQFNKPTTSGSEVSMS